MVMLTITITFFKFFGNREEEVMNASRTSFSPSRAADHGTTRARFYYSKEKENHAVACVVFLESMEENMANSAVCFSLSAKRKKDINTMP
jgi:hypothetical protein